MGWRNIFRNKQRTLLTTFVIGIGLSALILQDAFMEGMFKNITTKATETLLGHGQIHHQRYRESLEVDDVINNPKELFSFLDDSDSLAAYSPRIITPAMISSPKNLAPITLYGIDPDKERELSRIPETLIAGEYIGEKKTLVIGSSTADLLEVSEGDHVVVTVSQSQTGELAQDLFIVGGIFHLGEEFVDGGVGFVSLAQGQTLLNIGPNIHEVALKFKDFNKASQKDLSFWKEASKGDNDAQNWIELAPALRAILNLSEYAIYIVSSILFSLVALIITNSLFMSIYERIHEFGILRSIGTTPLQLFTLIMVESGSLGLLSSAIGLLIALPLLTVLQITGINYSGIDIAGLTIGESIYPIFLWKQITYFPLSIVAFTLTAARISPVKAMQVKG